MQSECECGLLSAHVLCVSLREKAQPYKRDLSYVCVLQGNGLVVAHKFGERKREGNMCNNHFPPVLLCARPHVYQTDFWSFKFKHWLVSIKWLIRAVQNLKLGEICFTVTVVAK